MNFAYKVQNLLFSDTCSANFLFKYYLFYCKIFNVILRISVYNAAAGGSLT